MSVQDQAEKTDLWGRPFSIARADSAPNALLRQQADALTSRTKGRIEGIVLKNFEKATAWASLYAKIPSLQGYMYKMLTVAHPATANPATPKPLSAHDTFRGEDDWQPVDLMGPVHVLDKRGFVGRTGSRGDRQPAERRAGTSDNLSGNVFQRVRFL